MATHFCITCQKELPEEDFYKNKFKKSGLQDHCKKHQKQFAEKYYLTNSSLVLAKASLKYKLKTGKIDRKEYEKLWEELK